MPDPRWQAYLQRYHAQAPGVTEAAFEHVADPSVGSPYEWLVAALPGRLGDVLDVACGNAALQPRLRGATSYLGVDLSAAELAEARERGRGPVTRGDARTLPVPDASVDTVVSSMGLMLVDPLRAGVGEIARVLRPGGTVGVLLPALGPLRPGDLRPLLALSRHLRGPGSMPHRVGRARLRRVAREAGLAVVHTATRRFAFPLRTADDARLAVRALYTPGRTTGQLAAAEAALARLAGPGRELPVPLLRVVLRKQGTPPAGSSPGRVAAGRVADDEHTTHPRRDTA